MVVTGELGRKTNRLVANIYQNNLVVVGCLIDLTMHSARVANRPSFD